MGVGERRRRSLVGVYSAPRHVLPKFENAASVAPRGLTGCTIHQSRAFAVINCVVVPNTFFYGWLCFYGLPVNLAKLCRQ